MADTLIREMGGSTPVAAEADDRIPIDRGGTDAHTTAASIAALAGGLPLQLPIQDGMYYTSIASKGMGGTFLWGDWAGFIAAIPFTAASEKTWTEIGVQVTTSDPDAVFRLGIYADDGGVPGALLVDSGELSASSANNVVATISQALLAGTWYWLAILVDGSNAEIAAAANAEISNFVLGQVEPAATVGSVYATQSYGPLPNPFPAIEGYESSVPFIWLRTGV